MDAAGDAVRVMTVHAAKGLESKIVILPDTCAKQSPTQSPRIFSLDDARGAPFLVWSPRKDGDLPEVAAARGRVMSDHDAEYRRLLYVALTRAEERLYVMGFEGKIGRAHV